MEGITFLILAYLTVFLSIKLSMYADALDKKTKLGGLLIGGFILASITSFPELVTSLSAVFINNPRLAIGDIFGSNVFNLLIISFLDIIYFKKLFFKKISNKYSYLIIILIIIYMLIYIGFNNLFISNLNISIISVFIFLLYLIFFILLSKMVINDKEREKEVVINKIYLKFILTAIAIIVLSVSLTLQANKIVMMNPLFSSSTVGAFLLGITTSLPEVVSVYALIKMSSYNLAFANIIGSNALNFLIFAICDYFIRGKSLYSFADKDSSLFLTFGMFMHIIILLSVIRKKNLTNLTYIIPSLLVILAYIYIFYLQFL